MLRAESQWNRDKGTARGIRSEHWRNLEAR